MSGIVLEDVASWRRLYLAAKLSHMRGRYGRASLPLTPSYGLQPSDKGTGPPVRCYLIPSCSSVSEER
jgi:hypothetical protein